MNIKFNRTSRVAAMGHDSLLRLGPALARFLEKDKDKLSARADIAIKPMNLNAKFDIGGGLGRGRDESPEPLLMQSGTAVEKDHGGMDECGGNDVVSSKVGAYWNIVANDSLKKGLGEGEFGVGDEGAGGQGGGGGFRLKGCGRDDHVSFVNGNAMGPKVKTGVDGMDTERASVSTGAGGGEWQLHLKQQLVAATTKDATKENHGRKENGAGGKNVSLKCVFHGKRSQGYRILLFPIMSILWFAILNPQANAQVTGHSGAKQKSSIGNPFAEDALHQEGFLPEMKVKEEGGEDEDVYLAPNKDASGVLAAKSYTLDDGMKRLKNLKRAGLRGSTDLDSTATFDELKDVVKSQLASMVNIRKLQQGGDDEEAGFALKSMVGRTNSLVEMSKDLKGDKDLDLLSSFGGNSLRLEDIPNDQLIQFVPSSIFDELVENTQDIYELLKGIDLSSSQDGLKKKKKPKGYKQDSFEFGSDFLGSGFSDHGGQSFSQSSSPNMNFHQNNFFQNPSSVKKMLHHHRASMGNDFSMPKLSKFTNFHKDDIIMAKHQLRVDALGDKCSSCKPDEWSCNCEKLFACVNGMTEYDLVVLVAGGFIDTNPSSNTYGAFTVPVAKLNLYNADQGVNTKLASIKAKAVGNSDNQAICDEVLQDLFSACNPDDNTCTNPNVQSYAVTTDQVCAAVNTPKKLLFEAIGDEFDNFADKFIESPCEPLSYETCVEFVKELDHLYAGRSTADYPLNNPMRLNSSSTVHDQSDYKLIFDRTLFPIRYNFLQDPTTGVVTREFGTSDPDSSQPKYFYLINQASGKALGLNDGRCTPGTPIEVQDRVYNNNFQQWRLTDDGRLESRGCTGMVLTNNWKESCRHGNELMIFHNEYQFLDGSQYSKCPVGLEVSQDDCLAAGNVLTNGWSAIANRDSLYVSDWNFTPCGCFVYINRDIDYDTNCGNAVKSSEAQLICKQDTDEELQQWIFHRDGSIENKECGQWSGNLAISAVEDDSITNVDYTDTIPIQFINPETNMAIGLVNGGSCANGRRVTSQTRNGGDGQSFYLKRTTDGSNKWEIYSKICPGMMLEIDGGVCTTTLIQLSNEIRGDSRKQWKLTNGKIESTLCPDKVMEMSSHSPSSPSFPDRTTLKNAFASTNDATETLIVLAANNDGGWNQNWSIKSNTVRLLTDNGDPAQQWEADFVTHSYDFALIPGFPGNTEVGVRKVRVQLEGTSFLHLAEVQVFDSANENRALDKAATQSSEYSALYPASMAVNGILNDFTHTNNEAGAWWKVDIKEDIRVDRVTIYNRQDCCKGLLSNSIVSLLDKDDNALAAYRIGDASSLTQIEISASNFTWFVIRKVRVQLEGKDFLHLAEVQVFDIANENRALEKPATQSSLYNAYTASLAVNGNLNDFSHTQHDAGAWWEVDMEEDVPLNEVVIWNRDDCCKEKLSNSIVSLLDKDDNVLATYRIGDTTNLREIRISTTNFIRSQVATTGTCLTSGRDKEVAKSAMYSCDESMSLLIGQTTSVGTLRAVANLVNEIGPERMPGECCMDVATNSEFFGYRYNPKLVDSTGNKMECKHRGPWHLGISEEACDNAGGKWYRSPCVTLQECIDDRPPRFDLDAPQGGACQDNLEKLNVAYVSASTSHANFTYDTNENGCFKFCQNLTDYPLQIGMEVEESGGLADTCTCLYNNGQAPSKELLPEYATRSLPKFSLKDPTGKLALGLSPKSACITDEVSTEVQIFNGRNPRQQFQLTNDGRMVSVACPGKVLAAGQDGQCSNGAGLLAIDSYFTSHIHQALVRKVRIHHEGTGGISLAEVQVFDNEQFNRALNKTAKHSSEYMQYNRPAPLAVNGNLNDFTLTSNELGGAWWEVDMKEDVSVNRVVVWNRDDCCKEALSNSIVSLLDKDDKVLATYRIGDASSLREITISDSDFTLITPIQKKVQQWTYNSTDGSIYNVGCQDSKVSAIKNPNSKLHSYYFALSSLKTSLTMGVVGSAANCQNGMQLVLQSPVSGSPNQQFFAIGNSTTSTDENGTVSTEGMGTLFSVMCPQLAIASNDCDSAPELRLSSTHFTWKFHRDGTIESTQCPGKFIDIMDGAFSNGNAGTVPPNLLTIYKFNANRGHSLATPGPAIKTTEGQTLIADSTNEIPGFGQENYTSRNEPNRTEYKGINHTNFTRHEMDNTEVPTWDKHVLPGIGAAVGISSRRAQNYQQWKTKYDWFQPLVGPYSFVNPKSGYAISVVAGLCAQNMALKAQTYDYNSLRQKFFLGKHGSVFSPTCPGLVVSMETLSDDCSDTLGQSLKLQTLKEGEMGMKWKFNKDGSIESVKCRGVVIGAGDSAESDLILVANTTDTNQIWNRQNVHLLDSGAPSTLSWIQDWSISFVEPGYKANGMQELSGRSDNGGITKCHMSNPAFNRAFDDYASSFSIEDATDEDQCIQAREEMGYESDHPHDSEVCQKFDEHMCDRFFTGVDHMREAFSKPPNFEQVEYEEVEYEDVEYEDVEYEDVEYKAAGYESVGYQAAKNDFMENKVEAKLGEKTFSKIQTKAVNPKGVGNNKGLVAWQHVTLSSGHILKAVELLDEFQDRFSTGLCETQPEQWCIPVGTGSLCTPNPVRSICQLVRVVVMIVAYNALLIAEIAHQILEHIYDGVTLGADEAYDAYYYTVDSYKRIDEESQWNRKALEIINTNIVGQHNEMKNELQRRHNDMTKDLTEDIFETRNALGQAIITSQNAIGHALVESQNANGQLIVDSQNANGEAIIEAQNTIGQYVVDAQNANGQLIVDAQNTNGQAIVDTRNAMSDQHNQMLEFLQPNICLIYENQGGSCHQFIGPLKEHQDHIPIALHWPEGQSTVMERLEQIEIGGDDVREALAGIQRALALDVSGDAVDRVAKQTNGFTVNGQTVTLDNAKRGEERGADQVKISSSRRLLVAETDAKAMELLKEQVNEMKSKMEDSNRRVEVRVDAIESSMKKEMKDLKEMMSQMMKMMG